MELGEIRELDDSIIRIIGFDDIEVFYDVSWNGEHDWALNRARTAIFYRLPREYAEKNTIAIGKSPLNNKEMVKLQPNLPLRLCVLSNICWSAQEVSSIENFKVYLGKNLASVTSYETIHCNKVSVIPLGSKGGAKPAVTIESENDGFDPLEFLWLCFNIQSKYETSEKNGIGVYRSGIKGSIPSYYLGGKYDLAGNNKP